MTFLSEGGLPRLAESTFVGVPYRNLRREPPPLRDAVLGEFGWGFAGGWSFREDRRYPQRAFAHLQGFHVADETVDWSRFAAIGVGVHGAVAFDDALRPRLLFGPRFSLVHRRPLSTHAAHALRAEAVYSPAIDVAAIHLEQRASIDIRVDTPTRLGSRVFIAGVGARFEWSRDRVSEQLAPSLFLRLEPLPLEDAP